MKIYSSTLALHRFFIVSLLWENAFFENPQVFDTSRWMTLRQIAREVDLKPTAYLRGIVNELCSDGYIFLRDGRAKNKALRYEYQVLIDIDECAEFKARFLKQRALENDTFKDRDDEKISW